MKFIYKDSSQQTWEKYVYDKVSYGHFVSKVVFECEAGSILEADKLYEAATGKNPATQKNISCEVIRT